MGTAVFLFLFVIAVSMDSFGIGCIIGMKGIQLSNRAILGIACLSGLFFLGSAMAGFLLLPYVDADLFEWLGALAFIVLGAFFLINNLRQNEEEDVTSVWKQPVHVLQAPESADIDRSGGIKGKEVFLLGIALSLDTIGAGISGVFIGIPPFTAAALIFVLTSAMLYGGLKCGARLSHKLEYLSSLPGILLILIGLIKIV
ncbi:manganese efflux pump [Halobacillus sp. Marseille-Q1614]|uniref:manganese efflux pump n=1 Tax=Halobacillus sp. Marseille-Q1614 TaxID=2709134 RepID=UPI00156D624B|nr:manganese efflux pump [Halobacillus sp. Marseille-Q1614]